MTEQMYLTAGPLLADAVDLMTGPTCFLLKDGRKIEAIDRIKTNKQITAWGETREISLSLLIRNPIVDAVWQTVREIERKLWQAERALGAGGVWVGTPVSLALRMNGATRFTYFDIVLGTLELAPDDLNGTAIKALLTLHVLPIGRGDRVTGTVSGTLTNGSANVYIANVPGDVEALCKLTLVDNSAAPGIQPPTGLAITTANTSSGVPGAITDSTVIAYRITALGATGTETNPCTEVTVTTAIDAGNPNTWTATLSWAPAAGSLGSRVYGRTSGGELLLATLPMGVGTWRDYGTITPSGAMPGGNTSKQVINAWHIGRRSAPGMLSTDYTPMIAAAAAVPTVWRVSVGLATAGSITLTYGGNTTASIAYNADAQTMQAAFTALTSVGAGNATVTGGHGDPWVITFAGSKGTTEQTAVLTGTPTGLTGGTLTISRQTGLTISDSTAYGSAAVRLTASQQFLNWCQFAQPAGAYQSGIVDVWARIRDSSVTVGQAYVQEPIGSTANGGTLDAGFYNFMAVAYDSNNNPGPRSNVQNAIFGGAAQNGSVDWYLQWSVPGNYSYTRIFYQYVQSGGWTVWKYRDIPAPTQYLRFLSYTSPAWTTGDPPNQIAANLLPFAILPSTSVNAAGASQNYGEQASATLAHSTWEWVYLGVFLWSPGMVMEDGTQAAGKLLLQAGTPNLSSPIIDCDSVIALPHDEPQLHTPPASIPSAKNLAVQRTWISDIRRDMRRTVVQTDGVNITDLIAAEGSFMLAPGNNLVPIFAEVAGGASDIAHVTFTAQFDYTPRYVLPIGLV